MDKIIPNTGEEKLDQAIKQWLEYDKNPKTSEAVQQLVADGNVEELRVSFGLRMEFGTAGLRAAMGAGTSRMNDLTIIQTTQGFCSYLEKSFPDLKERGVVIGFDARAHPPSGSSSIRFAKLAAAVFISHGVPVYLFSDITPTPFVPYTVTNLSLCAGIMVTASHNPKQDNGYKVYWANGAQIISPHDHGIASAIEENLEPWPQSWDETIIKDSPLLKDPYADINRDYFQDIQKHCFHREINKASKIKFVHTSVHGVGHKFVQSAFKAFDFAPPLAVAEQKDPDPEFSTVKYPNPEEGKGVLVHSTLLFSIVDLWGLVDKRIPTRVSNSKHVHYISKFSDIIRYMCSPVVLDKDGVSASAITAELCSYLAIRNMTLSQQLKAIYEDTKTPGVMASSNENLLLAVVEAEAAPAPLLLAVVEAEAAPAPLLLAVVEAEAAPAPLLLAALAPSAVAAGLGVEPVTPPLLALGAEAVEVGAACGLLAMKVGAACSLLAMEGTVVVVEEVIPADIHTLLVDTGTAGILPLLVDMGTAGILPLLVDMGTAGIVPLLVEVEPAGILPLLAAWVLGLCKPRLPSLWAVDAPTPPFWAVDAPTPPFWAVDAPTPPSWAVDVRAPPTQA
ncbi:UNVERIFIED_CONTAM: hypothetical protein FKN15_064571 [Acipenser sinensis]